MDDLSKLVLLAINQCGGDPVPSSVIWIFVSCTSKEILKEEERLADLLRYFGYSKKMISEIIELQNYKKVQKIMDHMEKRGLIASKQTEEKLLHRVESTDMVFPDTMKQLRMNLTTYKLTKHGQEKLKEESERTQGSRT